MQSRRFGFVLLCATLAPAATLGCDSAREVGGERIATRRGMPRSARTGPGLLRPDQLRKEGICEELFAPKELAAASGLDIAALELRGGAKRGCSIGGPNAPMLLDLNVAFVKNDVAKAARLFDKMTESRTQEDIEAAMVSSAKQAKERDATKTVDLEAIAAIAKTMPAANYVDVQGVGDRARMTTQTRNLGDAVMNLCTIDVLVRNTVFSVSATGQGLSREETVAAVTKVAASVGEKIASM